MHISSKSKNQIVSLKTGKLLKKNLPAAFCDTSFLLDYWNSVVHSPFMQPNPENLNDKVELLFIEYLKAHNRTKKIYQIRSKVENFENKIKLFYSPACRLELEEVITAIRFKKYGIEITETISIAKKGNKEIGEILYKLRNDYLNERKLKRKNKLNNTFIKLFNHFFYTTDTINEGLEGIIEADIYNLNLTKIDFKKIYTFSNLQVGFADIFHLITAANMGCKYFFTLDNDFNRIKKEIFENYQIEIVTDPERILNLI